MEIVLNGELVLELLAGGQAVLELTARQRILEETALYSRKRRLRHTFFEDQPLWLGGVKNQKVRQEVLASWKETKTC